MPNTAVPEPLFIRLYLDRHIITQLAVDLRDQGYDALTTQEAGMDTVGDEEQLRFALREHRGLFTYNIRDFAPLHHEWTAAGLDHAGIIVSQQMGRRHYGTLLDRMLRLLNQLTADELRNNFVHLEQYKQ